MVSILFDLYIKGGIKEAGISVCKSNSEIMRNKRLFSVVVYQTGVQIVYLLIINNETKLSPLLPMVAEFGFI